MIGYIISLKAQVFFCKIPDFYKNCFDYAIWLQRRHFMQSALFVLLYASKLKIVWITWGIYNSASSNIQFECNIYKTPIAKHSYKIHTYIGYLYWIPIIFNGPNDFSSESGMNIRQQPVTYCIRDDPFIIFAHLPPVPLQT